MSVRATEANNWSVLCVYGLPLGMYVAYPWDVLYYYMYTCTCVHTSNCSATSNANVHVCVCVASICDYQSNYVSYDCLHTVYIVHVLVHVCEY